MRLRGMRACVLTVVTIVSATTLAQPTATGRVTRPSAPAGPRPGPAVLYQPAPDVPELHVTPPFKAKPLLVSGTDAYCAGEYLYQDYLFDDHGANTQASTANGGEFGIFPPAGDIEYPAEAKYARNGADIVEFRVRPTRTATVYRVTLNTIVAADAPMIGIGIDRDRAGSTLAWPANAGLATPGLDAFITASSSGVDVYTGSGLATKQSLGVSAVAIDVERNQMTVTVPRWAMDPGSKVWRYVAGAGLRGSAGFLPVDAEAPAIFNLAFRFTEKQRNEGSNTSIGNGNWFEEGQANAIADGTTGEYFADVDFGKARTSTGCSFVHAPGLDQARVLGSRLDVPEGVRAGKPPNFGGRLQPYLLHLPQPSAARPGIVLALHGNTATYTQWASTSPNYIDQIGRQRNSVVISPLGRSTQGSGIEFDFFEAWADAARAYKLDANRAVVSGYSAGGYMTYVIGLKYPDLFGGAFSIVGAGRLLNGGTAGDHTNFNPLVGNARWVPYVAWNQLIDELAPYVGVLGTHDRFNQLGLRNQLYTFPVGEHFTPGLLDQWIGARDFLGAANVTRDPHRVDYGIAPETWEMLAPGPGKDERFPEALVKADHAYWVSGLRHRADVRDETNTIRAYITAVSHAFGTGDAPPVQVVDAYAGPPAPATIHGRSWGPVPTTATRNALDVTLTNIAKARIWGTRAKLSGAEPLEITITSDGDATVRIMLPFAPGTTVTPTNETAESATWTIDSQSVVLHVGAGVSKFSV